MKGFFMKKLFLIFAAMFASVQLFAAANADIIAAVTSGTTELKDTTIGIGPVILGVVAIVLLVMLSIKLVRKSV